MCTQALALLAQPANSPAALALLAELLDTIWYAAGDSATDGSWYTKRATLGAVYAATELYMLTDYSPGETEPGWGVG
jgi:ubiquinone biosynthesis protein COQ9